MKEQYVLTDFLQGLVPVQNELPTKLHRLPLEHLKGVRERGQSILRATNNNEVRFCMESDKAELVFEFGEDGGMIEVYFGSFRHSLVHFKGGIQNITVNIPPMIKEWKNKKNEKQNGFSVDVVRLVIAASNCTIVNIPDNVRPVKQDELPKQRYVAYGTSITQGGASSYPSMCYVRQVARNLKCDVINLGVSGNAFCEESIADYIGNEISWDFMTCCVSVNMLNNGVTHLEFKEKIHKFLSIILEKNPNKVIFCMSVLPYHADWGFQSDKIYNATPDEYRKVLQEVVDSLNKNNNLVYVHGPDMLTDMRGLSCDLIHPNDFGHTEIAKNLTEVIREKINDI